MKKEYTSFEDEIEDLPEDEREEASALMKVAKARNAAKNVFASEHEIERRSKEKGIPNIQARKELINESYPQRKKQVEETIKLLKPSFPKNVRRKFGLKGAGRPKGSKNKNTKISMKEFYMKLKTLVVGKKKNEEELTQLDAATALGFKGSRQLRRWLREHGDERKWKDLIEDLGSE